MTREQLLAGIRKEFGEDSMFLLGRDERVRNIELRGSGSLLFDIALGGGLPKGRLVEFRGAEKVGKSSLACLAIAEAQINEPDKENAYIDLEQSFNAEWSKKLGVNIDNLFFAQPETFAERVYDLIEYLLQTGRFAIIVVDSIAGLIPQSEFEENDWTKESRVGGASKLNSLAMRKLINSGLLNKSGTTLIFINQIRDKIGGFSLYGTPTTTVGGWSIRHNASIQVDVAIGDYFTKGTGDNKQILGQQMKLKVVKNKIAPPYRTARIDLYYEQGVDRLQELIEVARLLNIIVGTSWLSFINPETGEIETDGAGNELKWHGMTKLRQYLEEDISNNGDVHLRLYKAVQKALRR